MAVDLLPGRSVPYGLGAILSPPIPPTSGLYAAQHDFMAVQQNNDLRNYKGQSLAIPVRNQARTSACTAFAGTAVRAALTAKYHIDRGEVADIGDVPSARYAYYYTRRLDGDPGVDQGASMQSASRVYVDYGVSPARFDEWDDAKAATGDLAWLNMAPSAQAEAGAQFFGASGYARLGGTGSSLLASVLQCLADGYPPMIAIMVCMSFEQTGSDGHVRMPSSGEQILGGHALAVFGSFADGSFPGGGCLVVQNSWSEQWGQGGWLYLPWAYFTTYAPRSNQLLLSEAWTVR